MKCKKTVSFFLLIAFMATLLSPLPVHAAQEIPANFPETIKNIAVPETLGKIQESFQGASKKTVVIVQDAHAVPEAQKNIQRLIGFFQKKYGVIDIGLEGAGGKLDPQIFRSFPDQKKLRKVFRDYFHRGELTGTTAAAIFNPNPANFYGIEDWSLYDEGLGLFLKSMDQRPDMEKKLKAWSLELQSRKEKEYSAKLLEVDRALGLFHEHRQDFLETFKKLAALKAPGKETKLAALADFLKASGDESRNPQLLQAAKIVRKFMESGKIAPALLRKFHRQTQSYENSAISAGEYAQTLLELLEVLHPSKIQLPEFEKLKETASVYQKIQAIEGPQLFQEFETYTEDVKESFLQNNLQRALNRETSEFELAEKLSALEMNRKEWSKVKDSAPGFESGKRKEIWKELKPNFDFYRNAEQRDGIFLKNLEKELAGKRGSVKTSLLIAGGFHAQGLTQKLKEKNISYLLIAPQIKKLPKENHYQEQMRGDVSWKNYFKADGENGLVYEAFVRAVRDQLLADAETRQTAKYWRDQIIRDLAKENQTGKARDYTRFLDEMNSPARAEMISFDRVGQFVTGLKKLQAEHRISPEAVMSILKPGTMEAKYLSVLDKTARRGLSSLTLLQSRRSEMRDQNPRLLRERAKKNEDEAWELLKEFHSNEAFDAFFWSYIANAPPAVLGQKQMTPEILKNRIKSLFDLWSDFKKRVSPTYSVEVKMEIPIFSDGRPENFTEITMIAKDRVGLLKDVAGFMAAEPRQWNILRDYTFEPEPGFVTAFFEIQKDGAPVQDDSLLRYKLSNAAGRKKNDTAEIKLTGGVSNGQGGYSGSVATFQGFQGGLREVAYNIFSSLSPELSNGERSRKIHEIQSEDQNHLNETIDELIEEITNFHDIFSIQADHAEEIGKWMDHIRDQVIESTPAITVDSKSGEPKPQLSSVVRFLDLLTSEFSLSKAPRSIKVKALTEIENRLSVKVHGRFHLFSGQTESEGQQLALIQAEVERFKEKMEAALTALRKKAEKMPRLTGLIKNIEGETGYQDQIIRAIESQSISAQHAVLKVLVPALKKMREEDWAKMKDNALDLESIFTDVYLLLRGTAPKRSEVFSGETTGDIILFAQGLTILELMEKLEEFPNIRMIVTDEGTLASHGVILASESGVPFLILPQGSLDQMLENITVGDPVIASAAQGTVFVRPSEENRKKFSEEQIIEDAVQKAAAAKAQEPAVSQTGARLFVRGSSDQPEHISAALSNGADSIGLYRTEFQFKGQILEDYLENPNPENREAFKNYLRDTYLEAAKDIAEGQFITIRTYDYERDKDFGLLNPTAQYGLDYYRTPLGRDLLQIQLEALLEANALLPQPVIHILFPMFRHPDDLAHRIGYKSFSKIPRKDLPGHQQEFDSLLRADVEWLSDIYARSVTQVAGESIKPDAVKKTQKGFMIETREGIHIIDDLLAHSDFINVGTSDLLVSLYRQQAVSRDNQEHQARFSQMRPAFIRAVETILEKISHSEKKPGAGSFVLDFCGIKASDPALWLLLMQKPIPDNIQLGVSLSQDRIALSKSWIRTVQAAHLEPLNQPFKNPERKFRAIVGEVDRALRQSPEVLQELSSRKEETVRSSEDQSFDEEIMGAKAEKIDLPDGRIQETRIYRTGPVGLHMTPVDLIMEIKMMYGPLQLTVLGNRKKVEINNILDMTYVAVRENSPVAIQITGEPKRVEAFFNAAEKITEPNPKPEWLDARVLQPFSASPDSAGSQRAEIRKERILETIQRDIEGLTRKNTEGLIPLGVVFLHVFQALEEAGVNKDFRGLKKVSGELEIKDQIVYYAPSKLLPKAVLLGYDMDVFEKKIKNGLDIQTEYTFFPRKNLTREARRKVLEKNPRFFPFVHDDEHPVVMEFQTNPEGTQLENVSAVYFGGIASGKFLKFEILEKKSGKDDWEPLDLENLLFEKKSEPLIWTPDTPKLSAEPVTEGHLKAFLEQLKSSSRQVFLRVSETGDPRTENRAEALTAPRPEIQASNRSFETLDQRFRKEIVLALKHARGNRAKASQLLRVAERTLYRRISDYAIRPDEYQIPDQGARLDPVLPLDEIERIAISEALALFGRYHAAASALGMSERTFYRRLETYKNKRPLPFHHIGLTANDGRPEMRNEIPAFMRDAPDAWKRLLIALSRLSLDPEKIGSFTEYLHSLDQEDESLNRFGFFMRIASEGILSAMATAVIHMSPGRPFSEWVKVLSDLQVFQTAYQFELAVLRARDQNPFELLTYAHEIPSANGAPLNYDTELPRIFQQGQALGRIGSQIEEFSQKMIPFLVREAKGVRPFVSVVNLDSLKQHPERSPFVLDRKKEWNVYDIQNEIEKLPALRIAAAQNGRTLMSIPLVYLMQPVFRRTLEDLAEHRHFSAFYVTEALRKLAPLLKKNHRRDRNFKITLYEISRALNGFLTSPEPGNLREALEDFNQRYPQTDQHGFGPFLFGLMDNPLGTFSESLSVSFNESIAGKLISQGDIIFESLEDADPSKRRDVWASETVDQRRAHHEEVVETENGRRRVSFEWPSFMGEQGRFRGEGEIVFKRLLDWAKKFPFAPGASEEKFGVFVRVRGTEVKSLGRLFEYPDFFDSLTVVFYRFLPGTALFTESPGIKVPLYVFQNEEIMNLIGDMLSEGFRGFDLVSYLREWRRINENSELPPAEIARNILRILKQDLERARVFRNERDPQHQRGVHIDSNLSSRNRLDLIFRDDKGETTESITIIRPENRNGSKRAELKSPEVIASRAMEEIITTGNVTRETAESMAVSDVERVLSEMDRLAGKSRQKTVNNPGDYVRKANARIAQLSEFMKKLQTEHPALFAAQRKAVILFSVPKTESETDARMLAQRNADQAASLSGLIDSADITGDAETRREFVQSFDGEGLKTQTVGSIDDISSERAPVLPVVYVKNQALAKTVRRSNVIHIDTDRDNYAADENEDSTEAVAEMLEDTVAVMSSLMLKPDQLKKEDLAALLRQLEAIGINTEALFKIENGRVSAVMNQVEDFINSYRGELRTAQAA